jgi:endoglucanase
VTRKLWPLLVVLPALLFAVSADASTSTKSMSAGATWTVTCPNKLTVSSVMSSSAKIACAKSTTTTTSTTAAPVVTTTTAASGVTTTTAAPRVTTTTTLPPVTTTTSTPPPPPAAPPGLHVSGNHLLNSNNSAVQLHGVNRSGTEYACIQGWGIFDGPNDAASVSALASWNVNIVRVPLNEDCWLGINGVNAAYGGANYINAIVNYVNLLHSHGMYAELSLMWGAPGTYQATYQPGGPDEDHSPAFWSSLASTFKSDPNVILAPWGETITGWTCFMQTGCNNEATYGPNNAGYQTAPMQQAVNVMRHEGYTGVISIPCIDYANICGTMPDGSNYNGSTWLLSRPTDPLNNIVAEAHVYGLNTCDTTSCFNADYAPVAASVPMIWGETGETYDGSDPGSSYISAFLPWADAHGIGYEAWTWDTWGDNLSLISNYDGTPNDAYASWVKSHYATL